MVEPVIRNDVKICFCVPQSEYHRLKSKLNLGNYDILCLTIDFCDTSSDSSEVYLECSILSDIKIDVPESAD